MRQATRRRREEAMLPNKATVEARILNQYIFQHGRCGMAIACGRNKKAWRGVS